MLFSDLGIFESRPSCKVVFRFKIIFMIFFCNYTVTARTIRECNLRLNQINVLYHVKLKLTYNMLTEQSSPPLSVNWICFWITSCLPSFSYEDMRFFRSLNKCIISQTFVEKRFNNSNILGLIIPMKRKLNINTISGIDSNPVSILIYYVIIS